MRKLSVVSILLLCAATAGAQEVASAPTSAPHDSPAVATTAPSQGDILAAESLRRSAMSMIHARWRTRGRAGRLIALASYAQRLTPNDPNTAWLLANIYQSRREPAAAAKAMSIQLRADPNDHALGVNYLLAGIAAKSVPSEKIAFAQSVFVDKSYPDPLRSQAAVELGKIFLSRGDKDYAVQMFVQAEQLDHLNPEAINGALMAFEGTAPPTERAQALVRMIQGDPRNERAIRSLASLLNSLGVHESAADLLQYVWDSAMADRGSDPVPMELAGQYFNVLLDAGRYAKAIEVFEPLMAETPDNRGMGTLLAEAYHQNGQDDKADRLAQQLAESLPTSPASDLRLAEAADQAWYYIFVYPRPDLALERAKRVAEVSPQDVVSRRLLGAAQLISGRPELVSTGLGTLEGIITTDPMAAAMLAEHYAAEGNARAAGRAVSAVMEMTRAGWSYRRARDAAAKLNLPIAPHPQAQAVEQIAQQLDPRYIEMGQSPDKHIAISIAPVAESVGPGDAMEIAATLTNIGELPVMLGQNGLMNPDMGLEVEATGPRTERFTTLPMVVWPAPRYLQPGEGLTTTVRLDIGGLQHYLARFPLDEVTLTVSGVVDPVTGANETVSAVPALTVAPATITRRDLLGSFDRSKASNWRQAYNHALSLIRTKVLRGARTQKMQAVRQIGELLTMTRDAQTFKVRLDENLKGVVNKGVLLAMMKEALSSSDEAVRAEMLAALCDASLDESIAAVILPSAKDPSPLVRLRLAEVLGATGVKGRQAIMDELSRDTDELVRQMVEAFE